VRGRGVVGRRRPGRSAPVHEGPRARCRVDRVLAVLVDEDARVDAFVSAAKSAYGLPLTHADGERAYRAYRSGDDSFEVDIQGSEYLLGLREKGDDLVLLVLGGEPSAR
jgi:hypothetical protein